MNKHLFNMKVIDKPQSRHCKQKDKSVEQITLHAVTLPFGHIMVEGYINLIIEPCRWDLCWEVKDLMKIANFQFLWGSEVASGHSGSLKRINKKKVILYHSIDASAIFFVTKKSERACTQTDIGIKGFSLRVNNFLFKETVRQTLFSK